MARKESNSESEAKPRAQKTRTAQQQAQQEVLARHIHSNGPRDKIKVDPLDFNSLKVVQLNSYAKKYNLNYPSCEGLRADILNSEIGKKTLSKIRKTRKVERVEKVELAGNLKQHFLSLPVKENEVITNFLYKVRNEDKEFKLEFK